MAFFDSPMKLKMFNWQIWNRVQIDLFQMFHITTLKRLCYVSRYLLIVGWSSFWPKRRECYLPISKNPSILTSKHKLFCYFLQNFIDWSDTHVKFVKIIKLRNTTKYERFMLFFHVSTSLLWFLPFHNDSLKSFQ